MNPPVSPPNIAPSPSNENPSDRGDRIIHLLGSVDSQSSIAIVNKLLQYNTENPNLPIHLQIFSPGGCVVSGLAVVDTMRHVECPVFTYCIGCAASMAAVILACGTKGHRYILPRSAVMIHQPSGQIGGSIENVRSTMEFHNRLEEQTTALLAEATGKNSETIREATRVDNWLGAGQARDFGLVDFILEEAGATKQQNRKHKK
jgi:ATP-dependent Clp protease protease subunit